MSFHDISLAAGKATLKVTMMLDFEDLNHKTLAGKKTYCVYLILALPIILGFGNQAFSSRGWQFCRSKCAFSFMVYLVRPNLP